MAATTALMDQLAQLYLYPGEGHRQLLQAVLRDLRAAAPAAARDLESFAKETGELSTSQAEELYVQTFDGNAECALELGWHLYGESYHRGAFLVQIREQMQSRGLAESLELPDHTSHLLQLVTRLPEDEAARWIRLSMVPALETVGKALQGRKSPYQGLVKATVGFLRSHLPEPACQGVGHE